MSKFIPNNFKKLKLTYIKTKGERLTSLTEMIEYFGYEECGKIFSGTHEEFTVIGVRK
jgi:hypothetical protein